MANKRKRVLSSRQTPVAKRRSPSPVPSEATPEVEERSPSPDIPTYIDYSRPLPTLPERQPEDLTDEKYQSIADSGVLKESLRRSRDIWLSEDDPVFEKFWTKPLKKRLVNEKTNPSKDCMTKLGDCELIIEPHIFEVRLYGVRDANPPPPPPPVPPQPQPQPQIKSLPVPTPPPVPPQVRQVEQQAQRPQPPPPPHVQPPPRAHPPVQHQPPIQQVVPHEVQRPQLPIQPQNYPRVTPPLPAPQTQQYVHPYTLPPPTSQRPAYMIPGGPLPHPSLHRAGAPSPYPTLNPPTTTQNLTHNTNAPIPYQQQQLRPIESTAHVQTPPNQQQPVTNHTQPQAQPQPRPPQQNSALTQPPGQTQPAPVAHTRPDPVIQLLATKAASDPDLKSLMRIVASGKASPEELKIFQRHIDELTPEANAIKARQAEEDKQAALRAQGLAPPQPPPHPYKLPPVGVQGQPNHGPYGQPQIQNTYQQQPYYPPPSVQPHQQPIHQHPNPPPHQLQPIKPRLVANPGLAVRPVHFSAIVFEFIQSTHGDRFLFPKHSILEYCDNGSTVIASFLLLKSLKVNNNSGAIDYYEPMTVTLKCQNPKTLEYLQKVVAEPEAVRTYMREIIREGVRAPKVYLVHRLRRTAKSGGIDTSDDDETIEASATPASTRRDSRRRQSSTPLVDGKNEPFATPAPRKGSRVKLIKKSLSASSRTDPRSTSSKSHSNTTIPTTSTTSAFPASSNPNNTNSTPHPHPPHHRSPRSKLPRSRKGRIADPTKTCFICKTSKTSLWRKAEVEGDNVTVCNACGIKWKTQTIRKEANAAAIAAGEPPVFDAEGKSVIQAGPSSSPASRRAAYNGLPKRVNKVEFNIPGGSAVNSLAGPAHETAQRGDGVGWATQAVGVTPGTPALSGPGPEQRFPTAGTPAYSLLTHHPVPPLSQPPQSSSLVSSASALSPFPILALAAQQPPPTLSNSTTINPTQPKVIRPGQIPNQTDLATRIRNAATVPPAFEDSTATTTDIIRREDTSSTASSSSLSPVPTDSPERDE